MSSEVKTKGSVVSDSKENATKSRKIRLPIRQKKKSAPMRPCVLVAITDRGNSGSLKDLFIYHQHSKVSIRYVSIYLLSACPFGGTSGHIEG